MKKRICFVGFAEDQPAALLTLKEAMTDANGSWECAFAPNGPKALEAMTAQSFDAVVTNMRMPGMNGAELLQQVGNLHPKALRFVLGNVTDQELIINCIGGTHHFIAQPCKPQDLISTIHRGLALDAWLSTDPLRALVPRLRRLPTQPLTYFEVLKQVDSPNASVQSIGEVIARDPAATARLLQMVNSSAFALDLKVTDPVHAVTLLGMETVKALVLCLQVFSPSDQAKKAGLSFDYLWDHSFSVANKAREIVMMEKRDARMANDAFTAGLLHDVGRIVLASNLPQEYANIVAAARQNSRSLYDEESRQLGATHAQAGAYLLGLWGMPAPVVEATALHHTPSHTFTREFSLLTVVHVANVFAHELEKNRPDALLTPELDLPYLESLGLTARIAVWRKAIVGDKAILENKSAAEPAKSISTPALPTTVPPKSMNTESKSTPAAPTIVVSNVPPPHPQNRWLGWVLAPASAVIVIATVLLLLNKSNPDGPVTAKARGSDQKENAMAPSPVRPAARKEANSADANSVSNLVVTPPAPKRGFESVKVQAIFYRPGKPTVMINGQTLAPGEQVNGVKVVSIGQTNVVLTFGKEKKVFQVQSR